MFDQVGGLSREEVAGMIERATSNFLKTMKGEHTISPYIGVFPCVCMRPCICICFDYDWAPLQTSFGPCRLPLLWVLGISGCSLLKDLEGWSVTSCCVRHPLLDQINVMCGWNVQQIFAIVKNVKDEFCQLYFMSLLKCIAEFTGGWKENFGKVCVSASLAKSRPTWYISAAIHTHRTT